MAVGSGGGNGLSSLKLFIDEGILDYISFCVRFAPILPKSFFPLFDITVSNGTAQTNL